MRLYSVTDITKAVQETLREKGFGTITSEGYGVVHAQQSAGIVSQSFRIRIEAAEPDDK